MIDVIQIVYDAEKPVAGITVLYPGRRTKCTVSSSDVLLFRVSNAPSEMSANHLADVFLSEFTGSDRRDRLRKAGYGYPGEELPETVYHLHAEASVVIDIFSSVPFGFEEIQTE